MSHELKARLGHTLAVAAFLTVCATIYWQSFTDLASHDAASGGAQYNAAFVPELLAAILAALCVVQLVRVWFGGGFRESEDGPIDEGEDEVSRDASGRAGEVRLPDSGKGAGLALRAATCVGLLAAFTATVSYLGYYITMAFLLAAVLVTLSVRNPLVVLGLSIGLSLAAGYVFGDLLNVVLPPGVWGIAPW